MLLCPFNAYFCAMPALSAVIITFNEEHNIARCLDSLEGIVDEVIVLDSFSSDATESICRARGVQWHQQAFAGHIEQKNAAMALASHDWVLALDADEALSGDLQQALLAQKPLLKRGEAWQMNRLTQYFGKWIRHGASYPDRKLRLWQREEGRWGGENPHDKVILQEGVVLRHLKGDLLHYSYRSLREFVQRTEYYAAIAAEAKRAKGHRFNAFQMISSAHLRFWRDWLWKGGFRDGFHGFMIALINAYGALLKYAYLHPKSQHEKIG
jgi:glycosyltransferase involved in cell wall biosynthesis